jgi:hypothetical protein
LPTVTSEKMSEQSFSNTVRDDLRWALPVARWSAVAANVPVDIGFIEPLIRRRLSSLSRMALRVAHDCVNDLQNVRVVFASRHGELRRTTEILRAIDSGEPVSPTSFSLSVLNAMTGIFGIARSDRAAASAISAGAETLGLALFEAHAQYAADVSVPVLVVYADEPADATYGTVEDEVRGGALAILLDRRTAAGELACAMSRAPLDDSAGQRFTTQSDALAHCLDTREKAAWRFAGQPGGANWRWSWQ